MTPIPALTFSTIQDCATRLEYMCATRSSAALPAFAWNKILLCGFHLDLDHPVVELGLLTPDFGSALRAITLTLAFVQLAQIERQLSTLKISSQLFHAFGYRATLELFETALIVLQLPIELQKFAIEKSMTPKEFAPLRAMKENFTEVVGLWTNVIAARATKQHAIKILELLIDLYRENSQTQLCIEENESAEGWLKRLTALRFPMAHARDLEKSAQLKKINWPLKTTAQFERQGDDTFIQLSVRGLSVPDLKSRIDQIAAVLISTKNECGG